MTKILKSDDKFGLIDETTGEVNIGGKKYRLSPNSVLATGDSVLISGVTYDIMEYNPSWFSSVARRGAQIIHPKDCGYIIARAGVRPGNRILEAGIGSGALSSALLWALGGTGRLFTMDVNEEAIKIGKDNVRRFQASENWEPMKGDVRSDGLPDDLDCVILDIPDPWNALNNVVRSLKSGGMLVTYSPTYNQSESTVVKMNTTGMRVLETSEIIQRNLLVRKGATRPDHRMLGHTAFITFALKTSGHALKI